MGPRPPIFCCGAWLSSKYDDNKEVAATAPGTFQDLQRLCTLCESHRQCARDLGRVPADKAWEDYCPNVAMLKLFNCLPWASRSEW